MPKTVNRILLYGFWLLLAYMPFHIFLSQSLSLATGGLDIWKVAKDVIVAPLTVLAVAAVYARRKDTGVFHVAVLFVALYATTHAVAWLINPDIYKQSAILGVVYNNRLPCLLVIGLAAALLNPRRLYPKKVVPWALGISSVVALLGLIQHYLPADIMTHFGYSLARGARPYFEIDSQTGLTRVMSTLREPNALGAFLILPFALLTHILLTARDHYKRIFVGGLLLLHGLAIFLTFSRSAWAAVALATLLVVWWHMHKKAIPLIKNHWLVVSAVLLLLVSGLFLSRGTTFFQQYVIHSNPTEMAQDLDSNDYHKLFVKQGIEGIMNKPEGHGPGTAGLVSIRNPAGGQLTENYYVQIGYEIGLIGLAVFIAFNIWLYVQLWHHRRTQQLALVLCGAFWGYVLMNMLLHTWSNEAVATQFFLLSGVVLAGARAAKD